MISLIYVLIDAMRILYGAVLYELYAERLPDRRDFWMKVSGEELQHAAMLRELDKLLVAGKVFYNLGQFGRQNVLRDLDYILQAEREALEAPLSIYQTVSKALRIERLMAECKFYSVVESDAPEFEHIAKRLVTLTKEHIQRLEQEVGSVIDLGEKALAESPPPSSSV
jgi:hypothetical protein